VVFVNGCVHTATPEAWALAPVELQLLQVCLVCDWSPAEYILIVLFVIGHLHPSVFNIYNTS
jgi:hypothetical protein